MQDFVPLQGNLQGSAARNTLGASLVKDSDQFPSATPAELVYEIRRLSGLTWAQIARIFDVSDRAPYHWASGTPVSVESYERLGQVVAALRYIDRGTAEENLNLLRSNARAGQTHLDLLSSGEFELARELAGKGAGRVSFGSALTPDAEKFNAPTHWGKAMAATIGMDETEIIPLSQPNPRRVKARRIKA